MVNDRRASLDEESETKPAMRKLVEEAFRHGASVPLVVFPEDGTAVQDTPKLTLVLIDPEQEWTGGTTLRQQIGQWTKFRGQSPRLYPGALVWCLKKPGRDLRDSVEMWLAWKRVAREMDEGTLGGDFDRADRAEIKGKAAEMAEAAKNEVWAGYRFVVLYDPTPQPSLTGRGSEGEGDGLETIDLGAGHSSAGETLCGRVIAALKSRALLNESVGAGYLERNWPPALKQAGAWPLAGLRQSFLNGSLTRLLDPDAVLRGKIVEFVERGDFGIVSGLNPDGGYQRLWFKESIPLEEVAFEPGVFLLLKSRAEALKSAPGHEETVESEPKPGPGREPESTCDTEAGPAPIPGAATVLSVPVQAGRTLRIAGDLPPEVWNRLGTRILPKLRSGTDLKIDVEFSVTVESGISRSFEADLKQILDDLGLTGRLRISEG
ncbi:MAG: hypothetical protein M1571_06205 [Firmicutes bacterium]|nr:hypothetical protein [Bacillota bacterium]